MSAPVLQSLKHFQSASSGGPFRGRDDFRKLDWALARFHEYGPSMTAIDRTRLLRFIHEEAQSWLDYKRPKLQNASTSLLRKRETAIKGLMAEVADQIRWEVYRTAKGRGRLDQTKGMELKGLSGNYIFEATAQPKGVAHPSASEVLAYARDHNLSASSKEGYVKARDQFVADPSHDQKTEQLYYSRQERMRHMLLPLNGKLFVDPYTAANIAGAYAMDEYGNLFAQEAPESDWRSFNHSTFCRGKQVVCAGLIDIRDGILMHVDNMSGHYKPGPTQLANLLRHLISLRVDITRTKVVCALGPATQAERASCINHASLAQCQAAGTPMKLLDATANGFLTNPTGTGLATVNPHSYNGIANGQSLLKAARAQPHIEIAHMD
ncbi:MAG: hypothetical protein MUF00_17655 [Gemmatimonadaceae bacterium]|nr:hypothetical protein [Gemmatimonadaceae bacterium]